LVAGGYGAVKGVIEFTKLARIPVCASCVAVRSLSLGRGAENVNAAIYLGKKLSQLEAAHVNASTTRILLDGRIRYYEVEISARNPGVTRGAARVTEYNTLTGQTRVWHECYDHSGNVLRVHSKQINRQDIISPHYPPTGEELKW
jgi:hypothetical protein